MYPGYSNFMYPKFQPGYGYSPYPGLAGWSLPFGVTTQRRGTWGKITEEEGTLEINNTSQGTSIRQLNKKDNDFFLMPLLFAPISPTPFPPVIAWSSISLLHVPCFPSKFLLIFLLNFQSKFLLNFPNILPVIFPVKFCVKIPIEVLKKQQKTTTIISLIILLNILLYILLNFPWNFLLNIPLNHASSFDSVVSIIQLWRDGQPGRDYKVHQPAFPSRFPFKLPIKVPLKLPIEFLWKFPSYWTSCSSMNSL